MKAIWDVTVESGTSKHEVEIDAISKKVIKSEKMTKQKNSEPYCSEFVDIAVFD